MRPVGNRPTGRLSLPVRTSDSTEDEARRALDQPAIADALRHVPGPTDSLPPVRPRLPSRNALPEVTGIMRRGGQAFAIINKRMVQEGEQIFGYTVREIGRTTVTLRDASGDTVIQVTK